MRTAFTVGRPRNVPRLSGAIVDGLGISAANDSQRTVERTKANVLRNQLACLRRNGVCITKICSIYYLTQSLKTEQSADFGHHLKVFDHKACHLVYVPMIDHEEHFCPRFVFPLQPAIDSN